MNLNMEKSALLSSLAADIPLADGQNLLIPIMWFDDTIDRPPTDLLIRLGDALSTGNRISNSVLIFSSMVLAVQAFLFVCYVVWKRSNDVVNNADVDVVVDVDNCHVKGSMHKTLFAIKACLHYDENAMLSR